MSYFREYHLAILHRGCLAGVQFRDNGALGEGTEDVYRSSCFGIEADKDAVGAVEPQGRVGVEGASLNQLRQR